MPLLNLKSILEDAYKNNYAIGAFNVYNIEDITAVIKAAEEASSPVILMTSSSAVNHSTVEDLGAIITRRAKNSKVPICLHLDHATTFQEIVKAINSGYTSVMFDGSSLPYEENVLKTNEVVKVAKYLNVSVEAEIGRVGNSEEGNDDFEMILSEPKEVQMFINDTNIDACAIAIGTQHGMQKQDAKLDFKRLKEINKIKNVPLVLHGSSGVSDKDLHKVAANGIDKVNIGTRLKRVFSDSLRSEINNNPEEHNHIKLLNPSIEKVKEEVIKKIKLLGCDNKA